MDDLLTIPPLEPGPAPGHRIVHIYVSYNEGLEKRYAMSHAPLTVKQWAKFGEPRKLPKPAPRRLFDPEADSNEPVGWTPTWNLR